MHAFGAHFAEVRVDPISGEVRVARWVGAFDCGRILNAKTARSQIIGGIIFGIGMALMEHTVADPAAGRILTPNLSGYLVPVHADVPGHRCAFVGGARPARQPAGGRRDRRAGDRRRGGGRRQRRLPRHRSPHPRPADHAGQAALAAACPQEP